jgi:hypothetical protein
MSAFQTIALAYVSATFSRSLNRGEPWKLRRSSYCASVSPFRPAWTERCRPQYSHSIDFET